jgi:hypothetical protein
MVGEDAKVATGPLGKEYGEKSADRRLSVFTGMDQRIHGVLTVSGSVAAGGWQLFGWRIPV